VSAGGPIRRGGIIAAGDGRRLSADGWRVSKPMVPVSGKPLIGHAMDRFREAGILGLSIIINEASQDCRQWLAAHGADLDLDLVVLSTPSSYASFRVIAGRLEGSPSIITTVDSILPAGAFRRFVTDAAAFPGDAVVLALTDHVDDEKPLWASLDPADGRILKLGDSRSGLVTAGLYALPARLPAGPTGGFERLRDYLAWLVAGGHPVYGISLGPVFDIDRASDIAAAERAAAGSGKP
jgi:NDP-sugar pyrophosphorylase family protein